MNDPRGTLEALSFPWIASLVRSFAQKMISNVFGPLTKTTKKRKEEKKSEKKNIYIYRNKQKPDGIIRITSGLDENEFERVGSGFASPPPPLPVLRVKFFFFFFFFPIVARAHVPAVLKFRSTPASAARDPFKLSLDAREEMYTCTVNERKSMNSQRRASSVIRNARTNTASDLTL